MKRVIVTKIVENFKQRHERVEMALSGSVLTTYIVEIYVRSSTYKCVHVYIRTHTYIYIYTSTYT